MAWLLGTQAVPDQLMVFGLDGRDGRLMGLTPVAVGFLGVELVAALVPRLRPLRISGPAGRARLTAWGWRASAAVMALGLLRTGLDWFRTDMFQFAWFFLLVCFNPLWTLLLVWLARRVSEQGLANGFAVFLLADQVPPEFRPELLSGLGPVVGATLLWMLLVAWLLGSPKGRSAHGEVVLRAPLSGLLPVTLTHAVLNLPTGPLAALTAGLPLGFLYHFYPGYTWYFVVMAVAVVLLTPVFMRVFYWGPNVVAFTPDGSTAADLQARLREGLRYTMFVTLTLGLLPGVIERIVVVPFTVAVAPGATLLTALLLDAKDEWRARERQETLVSVWSEHRGYAVDPLCAALTRGGIPCHARAVRYHTLMRFFAPLVPVELLVPRTRVTEALAVLDARNAASLAHLDGHAPTTF